MFDKWNNLAMKAITGQNSQVSTLDRWNENRRNLAFSIQHSKEMVSPNGVVYLVYPVVQPVR